MNATRTAGCTASSDAFGGRPVGLPKIRQNRQDVCAPPPAELTVTLSAEESRRFVNALDAPFRPNAKLKKALARVTQD